MSQMVYCIASRGWERWAECVQTWVDQADDQCHYEYVVLGMDVVPAYQQAYKDTKDPILAFIHDDVEIYEPGWDTRVLREFDDPTVGMVGFGGALGHGHPDLYKRPYRLPDLARQNFMSNMRSADKHGARFTGERDVAILDGFALFVRRSILARAGGWPIDEPVGYFLYSEWLCCETRRQGFRIRLVGIDCEHLGGKSSGWISPNEDYEAAHAYFYEHNRDVMPYRVKE